VSANLGIILEFQRSLSSKVKGALTCHITNMHYMFVYNVIHLISLNNYSVAQIS